MATETATSASAASSDDGSLPANAWTTLPPADLRRLHEKAAEIIHSVPDSHPRRPITLGTFGGYVEHFDSDL